MTILSCPLNPACQLFSWYTTRQSKPPTPRRNANAVLDDAGSQTTGQVTSLDPRQISQSMSFAMTTNVYQTIRRTIGSRRAESGAVLGGSRKLGIITHIHLDQSATVSGVTYSPNIQVVNDLLREEWDPQNIDFMGFVHSHPGLYTSPSQGDRIYAERILTALPKLDRMAMPIVRTIPDTGEFLLNGFMVVRTGTPKTGRWLNRPDGSSVGVLEAPLAVMDPARIHQSPHRNPYLERVGDAYDPKVMASTRVVAIGVGGSMGFLEKMARMGTGQFVLIDPDVIEPKNIGTQDADPADIGKPKVEALGDKLARLNPNCHIWTIQAKENVIDDTGFHRLLREPLAGGSKVVPALTLLCAFTDNFAAQDRVQRLGLHFGVPTLAAAVHQQGRATEIAFAAPGLTRACIRCAQSARYRQVLQENKAGAVASDGTPILATDRLNESKQIVTLAMLHTLNPLAQENHPATIRYRGWMDHLEHRNLALTRLDPESPLPSFRRLQAVTDGACVIDETVWTKPTPDSLDDPGRSCPDCGGFGNLADAVGTFADTRTLTRAYGQARRGNVPVLVPLAA